MPNTASANHCPVKIARMAPIIKRLIVIPATKQYSLVTPVKNKLSIDIINSIGNVNSFNKILINISLLTFPNPKFFH